MSTEMRSRSLLSAAYLVMVTLVTVAAASAAQFLDSRPLAVAAGVLAVYGLHLLSIRSLVRSQNERRAVVEQRLAEIRERRPPLDPDSPTARRGLEPQNWWNIEVERLKSEAGAGQLAGQPE